MNLTCPECKNAVNLAPYGDIKVDQHIECDICGISLIVTKKEADIVEAEVTDEGK